MRTLLGATLGWFVLVLSQNCKVDTTAFTNMGNKHHLFPPMTPPSPPAFENLELHLPLLDLLFLHMSSLPTTLGRWRRSCYILEGEMREAIPNQFPTGGRHRGLSATMVAMRMTDDW